MNCYVVDTLFDHLYDLYTSTQFGIEIWEALAFKFKVEEEGSPKLTKGYKDIYFWSFPSWCNYYKIFIFMENL